jgi:hypothetical protein
VIIFFVLRFDGDGAFCNPELMALALELESILTTVSAICLVLVTATDTILDFLNFAFNFALRCLVVAIFESSSLFASDFEGTADSSSFLPLLLMLFCLCNFGRGLEADGASLEACVGLEAVNLSSTALRCASTLCDS